MCFEQVGRVSEAYGGTPDKIDWNPNCDFNGNNMIGILDLCASAKTVRSHLANGEHGLIWLSFFEAMLKSLLTIDVMLREPGELLM